MIRTIKTLSNLIGNELRSSLSTPHSIILTGSLVRGDFVERYSDIDLLAVIKGRALRKQIMSMNQLHESIETSLHAKLDLAIFDYAEFIGSKPNFALFPTLVAEIKTVGVTIYGEHIIPLLPNFSKQVMAKSTLGVIEYYIISLRRDMARVRSADIVFLLPEAIRCVLGATRSYCTLLGKPGLDSLGLLETLQKSAIHKDALFLNSILQLRRKLMRHPVPEEASWEYLFNSLRYLQRIHTAISIMWKR